MTSIINIEELEKMKRAELQKLAKKAGIKANMKTVQLIESLKQHFMKELSVDNSTDEDNKEELKSNVPEGKVTPTVSKPKENKVKQSSSGKKTKKIKRSTYEIAPEDAITTPKAQKPAQKRKRSSSSKTKSSPLPDASNKVEPPAKKKKSNGRSSENGPKRSSPRLSPKEQTVKPLVGKQEEEKEGSSESDLKLKASIMAEIDKKVQERKSQTHCGGKIPRFAAFAAKNQEKKPVTPGNKDWAQLHQKQFEKMEGIDAYLERKRKRMEALSASAKKAKTIADEAKSVAETLKTPKSAVKPKIAKPVVRIKTPDIGLKSPKPFVPSVTNIKSIKTDFTKSALKTPQKPILPPLLAGTQSKTQTPGNAISRKSFGSTLSKSQSRKSTVPDKNMRKSLGDTRKSFGGGLAPVTPNPKKVFDLKASLEKPLSYRPHTGKLKPLCESSYLKTNKPLSVTKAKEQIKKPKITSRDERRTAFNRQRQSKKNNSMMARRGIMT
ncbi:nucleolar and spindle-associated protein 1-like [Ptychodera flava]|uniref:nucleolar and spindle-associated protein 1-like n=1 Tax=Ptychodera flava TaxID=63121 RepID=UPI00396A1A33